MPKRSWWIDKRRVLHCYSSSRADCRVTSLVDLPETSDFYDFALAHATEEINGHLRDLAELAPEGLEPSMIIVEGAPFLAWTQPSDGGPDQEGAIGPDAHPDTIIEALRLDLTGRKPHKRSWVMIDLKVWCYASPKGDCLVGRLWESLDAEAGSFHDSDLAKTTWKVNAVLEGLHNDRTPSFVVVDDGLLLSWTQPALGPDDEAEAIRRSLGLSS